MEEGIIVDAKGASGGMAVWWDKDIREGISIVENNNHMAVLFTEKNSKEVWILSNIYAPNTTMGRRKLWEDLKVFRNQSAKFKWIVAGDFNSPLSTSEKKGGITDFSESTKDLASLITDCELFDVELRGNPYTWTNRRMGGDNIQVRLDRVLLSKEWMASLKWNLNHFHELV